MAIGSVYTFYIINKHFDVQWKLRNCVLINKKMLHVLRLFWRDSGTLKTLAWKSTAMLNTFESKSLLTLGDIMKMKILYCTQYYIFNVFNGRIELCTVQIRQSVLTSDTDQPNSNLQIARA